MGASLAVKINRNALKRALRVDKLRTPGLEALLRPYSDPDRLSDHLPVLRHMSRPAAGIQALAGGIQPVPSDALAGRAAVGRRPFARPVQAARLRTSRQSVR